MPHNLYNATQVANQIALAATGTVVSAASLIAQTSDASLTLGAQLNVTHSFMYLQIPLWWFFIASVVLAFVGAFWSLSTDTLREGGTRIGKLLTAATVGLIATFVILPSVIDAPNVILMMITSLGGGFSGTVLLYLAARLINNKELHDSVVDIISEKIVAIIRFLLNLLPSGSSNTKRKDDNDDVNS